MEKTIHEDAINLVTPIRADGRYYDTHKARKPHTCDLCQKPIFPGEIYYTGIVCGSGVSGFKACSRTHPCCTAEFHKNKTQK